MPPTACHRTSTAWTAALPSSTDDFRRAGRSAAPDKASRRLFGGLRRAVAGRPALHCIGDIDPVAAGDVERRQHVVEQLAGLADERLALASSSDPGPSPMNSQSGVGIADAEYGLVCVARTAHRPGIRRLCRASASQSDADLDLRLAISPRRHGSCNRRHDGRNGREAPSRAASGSGSAGNGDAVRSSAGSTVSRVTQIGEIPISTSICSRLKPMPPVPCQKISASSRPVTAG